ncbi:MAG: hypothetical protein MMC33_005857 [Icmadophila ericetorum]|nr:hypothetical protein [Icmadophila ericetorum]
MVSADTYKTLLFTLGPLILPRLWSFYKTVRAQSNTSPLPVRPVPSHVQNALNILFFAALLALISTFPTFAEENIFTLTKSRIQTPSDVLYNRLKALRSDGVFTERDDNLRKILGTLDGRCIYLAYGPSTAADCTFCYSDEPLSYFYYALPSIIYPYLLNLVALGLATSTSVSGKEGSRWRTTAGIFGACFAIIEATLFLVYDWKASLRALGTNDLNNFYWSMRIYRGIAIALLDSGIAALLWVASTNRLFGVPPTAAERLENISKLLESTRGRLGAVGVVRNTIVRDDLLRKNAETYWKKEGDVVREVMDEREVVDGVRSALESGRVNIARIEEEARFFAEALVGDSGTFSVGQTNVDG